MSWTYAEKTRVFLKKRSVVTGAILVKLNAPALGDEKIKNIEFADDEFIAGKVKRVIE